MMMIMILKLKFCITLPIKTKQQQQISRCVENRRVENSYRTTVTTRYVERWYHIPRRQEEETIHSRRRNTRGDVVMRIIVLWGRVFMNKTHTHTHTLARSHTHARAREHTHTNARAQTSKVNKCDAVFKSYVGTRVSDGCQKHTFLMEGARCYRTWYKNWHAPGQCRCPENWQTHSCYYGVVLLRLNEYWLELALNCHLHSFMLLHHVVSVFLRKK